jgi:hypothetical protein
MRFTDLATPRPINTAPEQDEEAVVLLYCPEQGGWHTGVFFDGVMAAAFRAQRRPGADALGASAA